MDDNTKTTLRVEIFGTEYPIRAKAAPEYIIEIARYVDRKMREVPSNIPLRSTTKIAILAALNIADELYQERRAKEQVVVELESRLAHILARLNTALKADAAENSDGEMERWGDPAS